MANKDPKHLRAFQFKPGESGNPGGRTKISITQLMAKYADFTWDEIQKELRRGDLTMKEVIALRQISNSYMGDDRSVDRLLDRTEGRPTQRIEIEDDGRLDATNEMLRKILYGKK